jgi:putative cardiolipin synthase
MHNKSFTVDNQVTIVGGRNIADEYFELRSDAEFIDFDVIAIGPVAAEVAKEFDLFWNHSRSVPMEAFDDDIKPRDLGSIRPDIDAHLEHAYRSTYARAIDSQLLDDLYEDRVPLYPANAQVVTDDPEKLANKISEDQQTLVNYLAELAADAESEIIVVTPYFVPGKNGVAFWQGIASKGVQVIVLTNSLASNNHLAVHSAYAKYRRAIIEAGVELYEARANAVRQDTRGKPGAAERLTLHSKAVIIDRELIFVGSLNMDPRAIDINTEMGIVIRSPDMAGDIAERMLAELPEFAYRLELQDNGKLHWRGRVNGTEVIETKEPLTSRWQRFMAFLLKIVPEQQL